MTSEVTLDSLVVRAIRQYREKTVRLEGGKEEPVEGPAPHPKTGYSLSGMAQTCLGCELLHAGECGEPPRATDGKRIPPLPCRDRQVLILMAKRSIASL